jgi:hypothetical protein
MASVHPHDADRLVTIGQAVAEFLALSDGHARARLIVAERQGFERGAALAADPYERGFSDGIFANRRVAELEAAVRELDPERQLVSRFLADVA